MGMMVPEAVFASPPSYLRKQQPQWRPDESSNACFCCKQQFSIWIRRHHCRACGELVCAYCSPYVDRLPEFGYDGPVRVCKDCKCQTSSASSMSPIGTGYHSASELSSSDCEMEVDEELIAMAVDVIASHSTRKHSKLSYQYFVQSEAVSWLVDAGLTKSRSIGAVLFNRLVDDGFVALKPWSGFKRSAFYVLKDDATASVCGMEARVSHYESAMHSETSKCRNCMQSYLESLTLTPGFCSIDCKTNVQINMSDSARIRRYC